VFLHYQFNGLPPFFLFRIVAVPYTYQTIPVLGKQPLGAALVRP